MNMFRAFNKDLQQTCGLSQVTVYNIHPSFKRIFAKGVTQEQKDSLHHIEFNDMAPNTSKQFLIAACTPS